MVTTNTESGSKTGMDISGKKAVVNGFMNQVGRRNHVFRLFFDLFFNEITSVATPIENAVIQPR
ncbi:hypothetical protein [Spirosoma spitsbergense]|uniref:hypothetical protein n=1 Tax=Spirosoma spitsbergense TaxID=431554 RepID=UPI0003A10023|nr:hypothetical protein [Spirosoma spitsbergense]